MLHNRASSAVLAVHVGHDDGVGVDDPLHIGDVVVAPALSSLNQCATVPAAGVSVIVTLNGRGAMQAAFVDRAGRAVAQATAITMAGYYAGAGAAATTIGAVVDAAGSYNWAWLTGCTLQAGAAVAYRLAGRIPLG